MSLEFKLSESFKMMGVWWLPGSQEKTITGELSFEPSKGIVLDTYNFHQSIALAFNQDQIEIINGQLVNGKHVTLFRCYNSNGKFDIISCFLGACIEDKHNLQFNSCYFRITKLDHWMGKHPIKSKDQQSQEGKFEISANYIEPDKIEFDLKCVDAKFAIRHAFTSSSNSWFDQAWRYEPVAHISINGLKKHEWFIEKAAHFQNFLTLCIGDRSLITSLRMGLIQEGEKQKFVDVIYSQIDPVFTFRSFHPSLIVVPFYSIEGQFRTIINKWYELSDKLDDSLISYFSVISKPSMYVQSQFLHLTQALESFHRSTIGGKYTSDENFLTIAQLLKASLPQNLEDDFKRALEGKIDYLNNLSLRTRLNQVISKMPSDLTSHFLGKRSEFVHEVCSRRDGLTHSGSNKDSVDSLNELRYLVHFSTRLQIILIYSYLRQIEISDDIIKKGLLQIFSHLQPGIIDTI